MRKLTNEQLINVIAPDSKSSSDTESSSDEHVNKRSKLNQRDSRYTKPKDGEQNYGDEDALQETESDDDEVEWEDIPTDFNPNDVPQCVEVTIKKNPKKSQKASLTNSRKRQHVHTLSTIAYLAHGYKRNIWLDNKTIQTTLKKNLPEKFRKRAKKFNKALAQLSAQEIPKDEVEGEMMYILKYLHKWFKHNFQFTGRGIRVTEDAVPNDGVYIADIGQYKHYAKKLRGNRDMCSQFLTATLRSLDWDARLVFSLPLLSPTEKGKGLSRHNQLTNNNDNDLLFPYFWTEVVNPLNSDELFIMDLYSFVDESKQFVKVKRIGEVTPQNIDDFYTKNYYPSGAYNVMQMFYVVAFSGQKQSGLKPAIIDVSPRYMNNITDRYFLSVKAKSNSEKSYLLFKNLVNRLNEFSSENLKEYGTLKSIALQNFEVPKSWNGLTKSSILTCSQLLSAQEVIDPQAQSLITLSFPLKGNITVYLRSSVLTCKTRSQWKYKGRRPKQNVEPLGYVVSNPQTIQKKRTFHSNILSFEEEKNIEELFSFLQTELWVNEELTKNEFGDIEIYHSWMVPKGYSWIKLPGIESFLRASNKSSNPDIGYTNVINGFKFKSKKAYPIKRGVLINSKDEIQVKKLWFKEIMGYRAKEAEARTQKAMLNWKSFVARLRIKSRLDQYDEERV